MRDVPGSTFLVAFAVSVAVLFGPAYVAYQHFDPTDPRGMNDASNSYLPMASGTWEEADDLHTFRIVVPLVAGQIARAIGPFPPDARNNAAGMKHLRLGFLVVNLLLVACAGAFAFALCRSYGVTLPAAGLAMVAFVTSQHAVYLAGVPLVDSLYLAAIGALLYAIRTRRPVLAIAALVTGGLAKEAFVLFVPLYVLYGSPRRPWVRVAAVVSVGGVLLGAREFVASWSGHEQADNLSAAWNHVDRILGTLRYLLSPAGLVRAGTVFGPFTWIPVLGLFGSPKARAWIRRMDGPIALVLPIAVLHALLSGNVGRMLLVGYPLFCVAFALVVDEHPWFSGWRGRSRVAPSAEGSLDCRS